MKESRSKIHFKGLMGKFWQYENEKLSFSGKILQVASKLEDRVLPATWL